MTASAFICLPSVTHGKRYTLHMAPAWTLKRVWVWLVLLCRLTFGGLFLWNLERHPTEFGFHSVGWEDSFDAQNFLGKGQESQKGDRSLWYQRTHFVGLLWKWNEMVENRWVVVNCSVYINSSYPFLFSSSLSPLSPIPHFTPPLPPLISSPHHPWEP